MTIAISLKVNDGVVLASDSASTLIDENSNVLNVYNSANKVFNLCKGKPIGAITWGVGNIGTASIYTLVKDLRRRLAGQDQTRLEWAIPEIYQIEWVAQKMREFIFDELYTPAFQDAKEKPPLGFIVAGYSSEQGMAEEYQIDIVNGTCDGPRLLRPQADSGLSWNGAPEAITRFIFGISPSIAEVLRQNLGVPEEQIGPVLDILKEALRVHLVIAAMPFQDAIDLAEFLVDLTIKFSRFAPGPQMVGGPIEIAAISKHEGFKWIRRKHYFGRELNPEDTYGTQYR